MPFDFDSQNLEVYASGVRVGSVTRDELIQYRAIAWRTWTLYPLQALNVTGGLVRLFGKVTVAMTSLLVVGSLVAFATGTLDAAFLSQVAASPQPAARHLLELLSILCLVTSLAVATLRPDNLATNLFRLCVDHQVRRQLSLACDSALEYYPALRQT